MVMIYIMIIVNYHIKFVKFILHNVLQFQREDIDDQIQDVQDEEVIEVAAIHEPDEEQVSLKS